MRKKAMIERRGWQMCDTSLVDNIVQRRRKRLFTGGLLAGKPTNRKA
jgi:hypothetical protein